ncbi:TetR/AcrR family transcriptional regulator C-terminal ligand-binding domain-containing protein [Microbacterium karelineae]|uniref:TetR/AcrR family transcriptional regulator C-terminal ligand-binding domain-containing protein n=1 Tax=Microbacterium karelineae TaxID=2654283 RepID=UPI0012EAD322|nr:TetR/AcrR family transcriptional regulator C-terminal ligand-binding domain-containing protein [Microbacterium karelineae]
MSRIARPGEPRRRRYASNTNRMLSARIIERAIERGEVPEGSDADAEIDFLVAPIHLRLLLVGGRLDAALARQSTEATSAAARAGVFAPPAR